MKNGYLKEYYRDGVLKASQFYMNDTLDDTTRLYHPNGRLKTIQIFKNRLRHGCWRDYNREGGLYSELFFKNGFLDSVCSKYTYKSLRLLTRITYNQGVKNGPEEKFYASGKPQSRVYYNMGTVFGAAEEWEENGKKRNNDFAITVSENDEVLLTNTLSYNIYLENPQPDDKVYWVFGSDAEAHSGGGFPLKKAGNVFRLEMNVPKNGFVMERVTIAAHRRTAFNNTFVKTKSFNVASNNF